MSTLRGYVAGALVALVRRRGAVDDVPRHGAGSAVISGVASELTGCLDRHRKCVVAARRSTAGLAALLDRRGALRAGEVVTLVVPVARALAALHRRGLVHGAVVPGNVALDVTGRPVLCECAVTEVGAETGAEDAEDARTADVRALATLALDVLEAPAPLALVRALEAAARRASLPTGGAAALAGAGRAARPARPS